MSIGGLWVLKPVLSRANLALQFEAVSNMPDEERRIVKVLLDGMISSYQTKQIGMIIKYQTKQMMGNLSS
ncbi:hypothetical protein LP420_32125 [Massilia sp. B-10]|nr:hypothetical protein LP420_32125 [Massilia sp. B-10]